MTDLSGKVALITGANTGIGRITARRLATMGATTILACRSEEKARPVIEEIGDRAEFLHLDLTSLESVRSAAKTFLATDRPLHLLVNNAGVAGQRGQTKDGFELHFGVNHVGHFLLTQLLLEKVKASAPARIVNVSSDSHYQAKGIPFDDLKRSTKTVTGFPEYPVSKLANVLFTQELARRLEDTDVITCALHPGVVATDAWRRMPWPIRPIIKAFMMSPDDGAKTTLHCCVEDDIANGAYYDACKLKTPNAVATEALAQELWAKSEAWVS